ncbi:hypothetical protein C0J52_00320 [Blattella germanica]|nr:hypothetical protein C0J52_00320 [Blattella germanica]
MHMEVKHYLCWWLKINVSIASIFHFWKYCSLYRDSDLDDSKQQNNGCGITVSFKCRPIHITMPISIVKISLELSLREISMRNSDWKENWGNSTIGLLFQEGKQKVQGMFIRDFSSVFTCSDNTFAYKKLHISSVSLHDTKRTLHFNRTFMFYIWNSGRNFHPLNIICIKFRTFFQKHQDSVCTMVIHL